LVEYDIIIDINKDIQVSGHSKWATIKRQKAVTDSKRGALFTKLGNNIAIAARGGSDPETNFTLRLAIDKAKAANMPSVNVQRSIDRGSGKLGGDQIQEVMYEGYGPGGVAILVECATDKINRTYPEVKLAFSKHGGSIAEKGAVAFQFERKGMIRVSDTGDDLVLTAIDAGADDVQEEDSESVIYTAPKKLAEVKNNLQAANIEILDAELTYVPKQTIKVSDQNTAGKIIRLMDALEDNEDVSGTHVNFDIPEEFLGE
jgi:YebC/PmpR family DNA-binding regulatory protein